MKRVKHIASTLVAVVLTSFVAVLSGCSATPDPRASEGTTESAPLNTIQAGGGILGALCTETTGNPLGKLVVDLVAGDALPDSDVGGAALCKDSQASTTTECRDYCETRNPQGTGAITADILEYSAFSSYIPAAYWSQILSIVTGAADAPSDQSIGIVQCATLVGWAAAEYYFASKACERGSECVTCDEESSTIRSGCLIGQASLFCAQALGYETPPTVSALSAACSVGRLCNKGIVLESCRRSCAASLPLAAPIALPQTGDDGTTNTLCCMCDRSTWEDEPWYRGGDDILSSEYYYSPVSDYDGPVVECEGKNRTSSEIAGTVSRNGYPEYYYYENCRKTRFAGNVCPQGNGYHTPL